MQEKYIKKPKTIPEVKKCSKQYVFLENLLNFLNLLKYKKGTIAQNDEIEYIRALKKKYNIGIYQ